ncbi:MAG TPA: type II CAAX endopeptidase family protein [Candidatus Acidoferrales bacterium]|nr:type II CAAX endopeptidase family protein [Candidatus Acidoferrales bacterium]
MTSPETPLPPHNPQEASSEPAGIDASTAATGGTPRKPEVPQDLRILWGWADLFFLLLFILVGGLAMGLAVQVAAMVWLRLSPGQISQSENIRATILIISQALLSGAIMLFLYTVVRLRSNGPFWRTLGWRPLPSRSASPRKVTFSFLAGGALFALSIQAASALIGKKAKLPIEELFRDRQSILLLMALGVLVAPVVEESIFRGYIYPVVARRFGVTASVLATGTLFGLFHAAQLWGGWGQIALLIVVGVVLTYVRARTGTVLASYLFHLGYNGILFLLFYVGTQGLRNLPSP